MVIRDDGQEQQEAGGFSKRFYNQQMCNQIFYPQAAQKFYALLVLKKFRAIEIDQEEAYADISVRRGDLFDDPKL